MIESGKENNFTGQKPNLLQEPEHNTYRSLTYIYDVFLITDIPNNSTTISKKNRTKLTN
jgi:hypothetical protein